MDCTLQLQVRENVVGFENALGAVKVIKDQIQYRSQSLLNLARGYFGRNEPSQRFGWVIRRERQISKQNLDLLLSSEITY